MSLVYIVGIIAVLIGYITALDYKYQDRQKKRDHEDRMTSKGFHWGVVSPETETDYREMGWVKDDFEEESPKDEQPAGS